jgi:hypothetical protein
MQTPDHEAPEPDPSQHRVFFSQNRLKQVTQLQQVAIQMDGYTTRFNINVLVQA